MGTPSTSATMSVAAFAYGFSASIHLRRTGPATPQATDFAESTLLGQRVALITDPTQDLHDRFGRTLAYLDEADGWDYSVEAARAGMAHSYVYASNPVARHAAIEAAEQEARDAHRGLWGSA